MKNPYEDMLHLLPPVSEKHAKMSMLQRAAQFSPFAALTGYEAVIAETGRLTEPLRELDDNRKEVLDGCLQRLQQCSTQHPRVEITHFLPDHRKDGGCYVTVEGAVQKIDNHRRILLLEDGYLIPIDSIFEIHDR